MAKPTMNKLQYQTSLAQFRAQLLSVDMELKNLNDNLKKDKIVDNNFNNNYKKFLEAEKKMEAFFNHIGDNNEPVLYEEKTNWYELFKKSFNDMYQSALDCCENYHALKPKDVSVNNVTNALNKFEPNNNLFKFWANIGSYQVLDVTAGQKKYVPTSRHANTSYTTEEDYYAAKEVASAITDSSVEDLKGINKGVNNYTNSHDLYKMYITLDAFSSKFHDSDTYFELKTETLNVAGYLSKGPKEFNIAVFNSKLDNLNKLAQRYIEYTEDPANKLSIFSNQTTRDKKVEVVKFLQKTIHNIQNEMQANLQEDGHTLDDFNPAKLNAAEASKEQQKKIPEQSAIVSGH